MKPINRLIDFNDMSTRLVVGKSPCGIVANVLDYNIVVSEFELHSGYYIPFRVNTLGEGYEPSYPTPNQLWVR